MNLKVATLFFRACRRYKVELLQDRVALVRKITARGKAKYLRDAEEYLLGKKVVRVVKKGRPNVTN